MKNEFNRLGKWKPIVEHNEIDNKWLRIKNVTYELPNGQRMEDYYIAEKPSVVVVIPIKNNQTYLIEEYERGIAEVGYKFPGGKIDKEEAPEHAAGRELQEELGLKANKLISLGTTSVDPGFMTTLAHYYLCVDFENEPDKKVEDDKELFEGKWVDLESIDNGIATNRIKNPFVIVGYTLAASYLRKQNEQ